MIGLLKKDIILIIKNVSYIYLIAVLAPIIPIIQNPNYLMIIVSLIFSLLFAAQTIQTLSLDEAINWNKIVSAMPVTIKEEIGSKYILSIFLSAISSIIIAIVGFSMYNVVHLTFQTIIFYVALGFSFGMLYNSIIIPAAYKFGTANCRFILFIFVLIPILINFGLQKLNISLQTFKLSIGQIAFFMLILFIVLMFISYIISIRIQVKKYKFVNKKYHYSNSN